MMRPSPWGSPGVRCARSPVSALRRLTTAVTTSLAPLPFGGHVLLVNPATSATTETPDNYAGAVEAQGIAPNLAVLDDPDLQVVRTQGPPAGVHSVNPVVAILLIKTR